MGAALPLGAAMLAPEVWLIWAVTGLSLVFLAVLGALGAWAGGAPLGRAVLRVTFWAGDRHGRDGGGGKIFGAVV